MSSTTSTRTGCDIERLEVRQLLSTTFLVTNTTDAGAGSLRQAILDGNNLPGDTALIRFQIPASDPGLVDVDAALAGGDAAADVFVIRPASPLPPLNNLHTGTDLDARSQTTFGGNTNPFGPEVVLDGSLAGAGADGLRLLTRTNAVAGLVIGGFAGRGILIQGLETRENLVMANYVGTNATGTAAMPNGNVGVFIGDSNQNQVGGTSSAERNVISGNGQSGVVIQGALAAANRVWGNYIGTDRTGRLAVPNTDDGVAVLDGTFLNAIGGGPGLGNLISGNASSGVAIFAGADRTGVFGNRIGTDVNGTAALPNGAGGIQIENATNSRIGDTAPGTGNTIAFNTGDGVFVAQAGAAGNTLRSNSIFSNAALGIDLIGGVEDANGVSANDPGDADAGPNALQNAPVLQSATTFGGTTVVRGTLNGTANATFRLEFFSSPAIDPSGFGEGRTPLGVRSITLSGNGKAFTLTFATAVPAGRFVTATATAAAGDTSEFSNALPVVRAEVRLFRLFNAVTNQEIRTINDGDVINLATLPTRRLNIRAVVRGDVGSVRLGYDRVPGQFDPNFHIENRSPFSLFGDFPAGDFAIGTLRPGKHRLTATPFALDQALGAAGLAKTIHFSVVG